MERGGAARNTPVSVHTLVILLFQGLPLPQSILHSIENVDCPSSSFSLFGGRIRDHSTSRFGCLDSLCYVIDREIYPNDWLLMLSQWRAHSYQDPVRGFRDLGPTEILNLWAK
jgi:hypothetical protein